MRTSKKIFSFVLSMLVLTTLFTFGNVMSSKALADDVSPVQLYYSISKQIDRESGVDEGYIAIKNLGYDKKVTIHYTEDGSTWKDLAASYLQKSPSDDCEVWYFSKPTNYNNTTFSIKYEVNGQTYWDNNNGNNYIMKLGYVNFEKSNLVASSPSSFISNDKKTFELGITLKNIGNPKTVKMRYSEDNWKTYKDIDACYSYSNDETIEQWELNHSFPKLTKQIQYSVCYTVNGIEYWDNNFGKNYTYTFNN